MARQEKKNRKKNAEPPKTTENSAEEQERGDWEGFGQSRYQSDPYRHRPPEQPRNRRDQ